MAIVYMFFHIRHAEREWNQEESCVPFTAFEEVSGQEHCRGQKRLCLVHEKKGKSCAQNFHYADFKE